MSLSRLLPPKPWSVATFEAQRPHLTNFVRTTLLPLQENDRCRRILVKAPVKCGKREMVEYNAMRDCVTRPVRVHAFVSAFHRKADNEQREELKHHNMTVFSIIDKKKVALFITWLNKQLEDGKQVVLHLDECDHGSGSKQLLSKIWSHVRNNINVTIVMYSATPGEVLYSGEVEDEEYHSMITEFIQEGHHIEYTPPEGYCGPKRFLDEGLVTEALPFFRKEGQSFVISEQGKEILRAGRDSLITDPNRNLLILRLSYSELGGTKAEKRNNKAIHQFLRNVSSFPELVDVSIIVDKDDQSIHYPNVLSQKIEWSSPNYWRVVGNGRLIIYVIDQTSSRSTEWACHDRIFAEHDFRNIVQFSTVSQAQERANHYEQRYGGFQRIRVYGHYKTYLLSAGMIDYSTFLAPYVWEKKKIDRRITGDEAVLYKVRSTAIGNALHPRCPDAGVTEDVADRILQEEGCYADISLSARVAGSVRTIRTYGAIWFPVTKETWDTEWARFRADPANGIDPNTRMRNPFIEAEAHRLPDGRWLGQHRGWKLLHMEGTDIYQDPTPNSGLTEPKKLDLGSTGGDRSKVCYKDNVLGVCVVRHNGSQNVNTLRSFNSMYNDRHM